MSKHTHTATTGTNDADDNEQQQPNKTQTLDSERTGAAAAAESALAAPSASAASPTVPSLSTAQRLYSDALLSVFGFLDLRDVIRAHASCRSWRDAARKEPSRCLALCRSPSQLTWLGASPLRHHVGAYSAPGFSECTLEQLASLSAFPALSRVTFRVDLSSLTPLAALRLQAGYAEAIAAAVTQWPSRLTDLNVALPYSHGHDEAEVIALMQVLIDCIGRLGTLTELVLRLPQLAAGSLTLQPLLQLTQLQLLKLDGGYSLGAADCRVLKQMRSLTHLNLEPSGVSPEALRALCAPPHQLALLQQISLRGLVTVAHMDALLTLLALSTLHIRAQDPAAFACLPRFPHLRSLQLGIVQGAAAYFMPHLTQCTQLTALNIDGCRLTLADLTELTRTLTALTSLAFHQVRFYGLEQPDSLACLRSLPQLREFTSSFGSGVRLVHLTDPAFTSLSSLRSLRVTLSADSIVEARSLFAVPCPLMPHLTTTCIQ